MASLSIYRASDDAMLAGRERLNPDKTNATSLRRDSNNRSVKVNYLFPRWKWAAKEMPTPDVW
ncbi:MAG TPA: hypothetical protein VGC89_11265 [Pyrinomonadaceae bacterium]